MLVRRIVLLCTLVLPAALGQTARLQPGAPRRFSIAPQTQQTFLTGFTVAVPPGISRLTIDLEPDVASHDLLLLARFNRDVAVQDGMAVGTDFSAQTIGTGREQIVITPASTPPLQTGLYYVAIGVATLHTAIGGTLTARLEGGAAGVFIVSTFDFDSDGWGRNFPESGVPTASLGEASATLLWVSGGGAPGGFLELTDPSDSVVTQDFVVAPQKFLGNLSALSNPRFEFNLRRVSTAEALFPVRLRILGEGATYEWTSAEPPTPSWTPYRVPIDAATFRRTSGQASLAQALSNVQRIEISMDHTPAQERNGLDNFALVADLAPAPMPASPSAPITSLFDSDTDGWGRNYPPAGVSGATFGDSASTLFWSLEGGFPVGALIYNEAESGADDFFVAPPKFLGNLARIANPRLEFDYRHVSELGAILPVVVRLIGAGSSFRWAGALPALFGQYQRYRVPLAGPFFIQESGVAGFAQALAAVERIEISADQSLGRETNSLDNVTLVSAPTPPLVPTLSAPAALNFRAVAGGATPAPQELLLTSDADAGGGVRWSAVVEPASSWLSVSILESFTPSRMIVAINLTGLSPGVYSGTIRITALGATNSPLSVRVSVTVEAPPAPVPRIQAGGVVNAASFRAPLAAGALASLFGNDLGPPEGVSAGFAPGTQSLPTSFRGVRVLIRDASGSAIGEAPLVYISRGQLNFQMPWEAAGRDRVLVVVDSNSQLSAPEPVALAAVAPGLFTHSSNRGVVQNQDFGLNGPNAPAPVGSVLIAYLTAPGMVMPAVASGQASPASPLSLVTAGASAAVGGVPASVLFLGLTPGLVGVAQANILVPEQAPSGDQILTLTIGGQLSNGVIVSIAAR